MWNSQHHWEGDNMGLHESKANRVLMIGIDSATFDSMTPWIEEGQLPNFARLLREGAAGKLESVPNINSGHFCNEPFSLIQDRSINLSSLPNLDFFEQYPYDNPN